MTEDTLPARVREWIAADGRSINALAKDAGMAQPTLSRFASGINDLTSEPLGRLLEALGAEVRGPKKRRAVKKVAKRKGVNRGK